ncbi:MAG: cyclophilin-like fold protein [Clostridia bacterium]|nr:cyclophilin-like fold protein [Clostridia bacterium]
MKKVISILMAFCLFATMSMGFSINTYADDEYNIIITAGGTELWATLYDNATTRELVSRMPMTLPMMDLYGREMCYRFSDSLPTDDVYDSSYEVGEIVYWPPGHSFVIMYAQNGEVFEMQKLGYVNGGVEIFANTGDIDVRIELADSREETTTDNTTTENTTAESTTVSTTTTETASTTQVTTEEQESVSSTEAASTENSTETTTAARRTGGSGGGGSSRASAATTETTTEMTTSTTEQESTEAEEPITEISTNTADVRVTIGSETVFVGEQAFEIGAAPYIQSGTNSTLVPLRFVSVALKGDNIDDADNSENVLWDSETKTVTIIDGNKNIKFTAMSNTMVVDGSNISMENGAFAEITEGRMYVPFRALGEALGINVEWEQDTKTAIYKMEADTEMTENNNPDGGAFGLGEQRSFEGNKEGTFTGNVWVKSLVSSEQRSAVSNVSFGCCARTDWHSHPDGQILLVTEGKGYYQIEGEQAHEIKLGDAVLIEPGVVHWHGGGIESPMSHVAITVNRQTDWGDPVTDEEYNEAVANAIPSETVSTDDPVAGSIFNLGTQISERGSDDSTFTGDVWLNSLIKASVNCPSAFSNVSFAPCSRTDWHSHPSGQILLVTGGKGYVQVEGQEAEELERGDVAEIAGGAVHWHGAAPDSYFNHVAITIDSKTDWLNPVSDEEYNSAVSEN